MDLFRYGVRFGTQGQTLNKELERTDKNVPASIVLDQAILKLAARTARVTVWCLSATVCPVLYAVQ